MLKWRKIHNGFMAHGHQGIYEIQHDSWGGAAASLEWEPPGGGTGTVMLGYFPSVAKAKEHARAHNRQLVRAVITRRASASIKEHWARAKTKAKPYWEKARALTRSSREGRIGAEGWYVLLYKDPLGPRARLGSIAGPYATKAAADSRAKTEADVWYPKVKHMTAAAAGKIRGASRRIRHGNALTRKGYIKSYTVRRVPLDRGGYTKQGRYFGTGQRLWEVSTEYPDGGGGYAFVRADTAREARAKVLKDPRHWGWRNW